MTETAHGPERRVLQREPGSLIRALPADRLQAHPRRQAKLIAAVVRHDPKLLSQWEVPLIEEERSHYLRAIQRGGVTDEQYASVLSTIALPVRYGHDEAGQARLFSQLLEPKDINRRMRRVVSFVTRGNLWHQDQLELNDLTSFIQRLPTAMDFETAMPDALKAVEKANKPEHHAVKKAEYLEALDSVGEILYGAQWIYLKQARILEQIASHHVRIPSEEAKTVEALCRELQRSYKDDSVPTERTQRWIAPTRGLISALGLQADDANPQVSRYEHDVRRRKLDRTRVDIVRLANSDYDHYMPLIRRLFEKSPDLRDAFKQIESILGPEDKRPKSTLPGNVMQLMAHFNRALNAEAGINSARGRAIYDQYQQSGQDYVRIVDNKEATPQEIVDALIARNRAMAAYERDRNDFTEKRNNLFARLADAAGLSIVPAYSKPGQYRAGFVEKAS